uniref:Uncharacterized protein n=1 Tax=Amphimedon queenslandica TaxID=400682 RepID=A0A1X7TX87_AMPQE
MCSDDDRKRKQSDSTCSKPPSIKAKKAKQKSAYNLLAVSHSANVGSTFTITGNMTGATDANLSATVMANNTGNMTID